jgi:hypothetical protein
MSANQNDPQYKLRWSSELREKIAESAKAHNRSMNADIVARLEQSFLSASDDEKDALLREKDRQIEFMQALMADQGVALSKIISRLEVLSGIPFSHDQDNKKAP